MFENLMNIGQEKTSKHSANKDHKTSVPKNIVLCSANLFLQFSSNLNAFKSFNVHYVRQGSQTGISRAASVNMLGASRDKVENKKISKNVYVL